MRKEALPTIASDLKVWKYNDIKDDLEAIERADNFWKSELRGNGRIFQARDDVHYFEERMMAHFDSDQPDRARMIAECESKTLIGGSTSDLGYQIRRSAKSFLDDI